MVTPVEKKNSNKFCDFHNDKGHSTDECMQLKKQIEELVRAGKLSHLIKEIKQGREQLKTGRKEAAAKDKPTTIYMSQMFPATTSLTGFSGETAWPLGQLRLLMTIGDATHSTKAWMNFMVVKSLSPYNEADEEKTTFHTGHGVYCYTKMPFGLKNAGATYQRLMDKAFKSQMGRNIEVYVDDLVVKSHTEAKMVRDIEETFRTLRKINMKLNPKKCSFGLAEGVFLSGASVPAAEAAFIRSPSIGRTQATGRADHVLVCYS
nr:reverse transcriptase domain-containing protein [Tanacetum cinerariifolium]